MRRVRQRDTSAEIALRRHLGAQGIRYRICVQGLPGRPDIANVRRGWAIQVQGCFWHGHEGCPRSRLPRTNREFWRAKIVGNKVRDKKTRIQLRKVGLGVMVVWECELREPDRLSRRLARFLHKGGLGSP
jgi:DNA mismatch endonuclease (patch repair protein)